MPRRARPSVRLGLAGLLGLTGCTALPVTPPGEECESLVLPAACRGHVHVFLVDGYDPLHACGFFALVDELHALGYGKVRHGYLHHVPFFAADLRKLAECDPEARVVLVGHGTGACGVGHLARAATGAGLAVDLVLYLDPAFVSEDLVYAPEGCRTLQVVHAGKPSAALEALPHVEHLELDGEKHGPVHLGLRALLDRELAASATAVPVVTEVPAGPVPGADEPKPRPEAELLPPPQGYEFLRRDHPARPSM
jgi:hypothetical protein